MKATLRPRLSRRRAADFDRLPNAPRSGMTDGD
jgi:hypothetical protein